MKYSELYAKKKYLKKVSRGNAVIIDTNTVMNYGLENLIKWANKNNVVMFHFYLIHPETDDAVHTFSVIQSTWERMYIDLKSIGYVYGQKVIDDGSEMDRLHKQIRDTMRLVISRLTEYKRDGRLLNPKNSEAQTPGLDEMSNFSRTPVPEITVAANGDP